MTAKYILNGKWDSASIRLFMKGMFCCETHFLNLTEESMQFLKDFASLGDPFASTDYHKIFNDFREEFLDNPPLFIKTFLSEIKNNTWTTENKRVFIEGLLDNIVSGYQFVLIKIICNYLYDSVEQKCELNYNCGSFEVANSSSIDFFMGNISLPDNDQIIFSELKNEFNNWSMNWLATGDHIINLNEQNVIIKNSVTNQKTLSVFDRILLKFKLNNK